MVRLRLVDLNAGLLWRFGGLLQPAPFVRERAARLGLVLQELAPDVIVLQEVYERGHRERLCTELRAVCPYIAYAMSGRILDTGLLVMSRFPMTAHLQLFTAGPL